MQTAVGVTLVKEGDRVGVPWLYSACGHCEYCLKAQETACGEAQFGGYTKNGGFAEVVADCITIRGSFVGTRGDMAEALAFAADGKVKVDIELQPLAAINRIFGRLEHGDVPSRVVLDVAAA
ncbi:MAG: alcohol dehydrogenase catalytic domain-containing protein [Aliidongia sp.]